MLVVRRAAAGQQIAQGGIQLGLQFRSDRVVADIAIAATTLCHLPVGRGWRSGTRCAGQRPLRCPIAHGRRQLVADLRQHPGTDQFGIDLLVQGFKPGHHVAVIQLVDDQLDLDIEIELAHRRAERLAQRCRADRVARILDDIAAADDREALIDQVQGPRKPVFRLCHHARNGQRILEFLIVDQAQARV